MARKKSPSSKVDARVKADMWYLAPLALFVMYFNIWRQFIRHSYMKSVSDIMENRIKNRDARVFVHYLSLVLLAYFLIWAFQVFDTAMGANLWGYLGPAIFLPVLLFYFIFSLFVLIPLEPKNPRMHLVRPIEVVLLVAAAVGVFLGFQNASAMVVGWVVLVGEYSLEKY